MLRQSQQINPTDLSVGMASEALCARLKEVWRAFGCAADDETPSAGRVHELRVGIRRALIAIDVCEPLVPSRRADWVRKQLKRLRKTAGAIRDLDVFERRLATYSTDEVPARYLKRLSKERTKAERELRREFRRLKKRHFRNRIKKLWRKIRFPESASEANERSFRTLAANEQPFKTLARDALGSLFQPFLEAARGDLTDIGRLHELRLLGKRLRDGLDVFSAVLDAPSCEAVSSTLEQLQGRLGTINDRAVAMARIRKWRRKASDCVADRLDKLLAKEATALDDAYREFDEWWTPGRIDDLEATLDHCAQDPVN